MKKALLILGAGQYGHVVRETAMAMGCFEQIDFLDDQSTDAVGTCADAQRLHEQYTDAAVAIGHPGAREKWLLQLESLGYNLPVICHPTAVVMPSARVGKGCVIEAQVVVNSNAEVGTACLLCAGAVVNHNAQVGHYCQIDCRAVVTARSYVPDGHKVPCGQVFAQ